jgi:putative hydrolase of the HAD superfamily
VPRPAAVFFDVDFTLIHPGPRFQAGGYHATCLAHGIEVDPGRFDAAVRAAAPLLDPDDHRYHDDVFIRFTSRIIEGMGGAGTRVEIAAREIVDDWAEHRHFDLYDDVPPALDALRRAGVRVGLISNSHRCLSSFAAHFALDGLISGGVSSSEHGYLKPHPKIFEAALDLLHVPAADATMVGDSLTHDIAGARAVGMRAILLARGTTRPSPVPDDVTVIHGLDGLLDAIR